MKGKWAAGIPPRNFTWVIKSKRRSQIEEQLEDTIEQYAGQHTSLEKPKIK